MIYLAQESAAQASSIWSLIAASGPLSAVLFAGLVALWRDNKELRAKLDDQRREQIDFMKHLLEDLE